MGYLVREKAEAPVVMSKCGESTRVLTADDTPVANLHVTHIRDSVKHYHRDCTEVYYVLAGSGSMELGDDLVELRPGVTVLIEPGTPHRAFGDLETIVFGVPAWRHTDEFYVVVDSDAEPAQAAR
jgi:mannose-6-phosphate isomerase-like protein (cupin superfamily)